MTTTNAIDAPLPISGANGGTGISNSGKTITLAGNLTTTGAFNPTLAFGAGNTYTFPVTAQTLLGLAGGTMTGTLVLNGNPSAANDAANKAYVDATAQGLNPKPASSAASTVALTVTYDNGTSGIGATLTNAGAMAAFSIDGYNASVNDVILIKDQASTFQNGLYTVTTVGSGAANWVLTRSTSMDAASEFKGGYTYVINGTVNAGKAFVETASVTTVGTDAVTFSQFSSSKSLTVTVQEFTSNGTYTPTTGMAYCIVEIVGGGGGGGGCPDCVNAGVSGGGGGGGYCRKNYTAENIGSTAAVVVGAVANGGAAGSNPGTTGNSSTFTPSGTGVILTATGGSGGNAGINDAIPIIQPGPVSGGTGTNGDLNITGGRGESGLAVGVTSIQQVIGGRGGDSLFGVGGLGGLSNDGLNGSLYGSGGGGGSSAVSDGAAGGGNGRAGICYITEFNLV